MTQPEHNTSHGACGRTWRQRGNRTGHCAGCHETFDGQGLFDAHFSRSEDSLSCKRPETMEYPKGYPLKSVNGAWRSSEPSPFAVG